AESRRRRPPLHEPGRGPLNSRRLGWHGPWIAANPHMAMHSRRVLFVVLTSVLIGAAGSSGHAQYFRQNKVQYRKLDFQVLNTAHLDTYCDRTARDGIERSARLAERWHARLDRVLAHRLRGRQPLVMYASHTDFEQTNAIQGELGEGTGGVTEPLRRRIV